MWKAQMPGRHTCEGGRGWTGGGASPLMAWSSFCGSMRAECEYVRTAVTLTPTNIMPASRVFCFTGTEHGGFHKPWWKDGSYGNAADMIHSTLLAFAEPKQRFDTRLG